ncbi:MAG TPA: right-handed parallel beta-helix repeat-containing protein, partial [Acidimicrobiales bacterium]|nr:right-handed parallel beta-helix repeat-containing protein [Acidimicrobiales bacterium]
GRESSGLPPKVPAIAPTMRVCGSSSLAGPPSAPAGAVVVPAGLDSGTYDTPGTTYYFASGTHTLPAGPYSQITAGTSDTYVGAPGAILSGSDLNDFAITAPLSSTASDVTVEYLTIEDFTPPGGNGAVNTNGGIGWTITHDTVEDNSPGAGVMIGSDDVVSDDCLTANGEYAFDAYSTYGTSSLTGGPERITLSGNEISYNDTCNWETDSPDPVPSADIPANCGGASQAAGCGCSGGGKFWRVDGATVTDNYVHNNYNVGIWVDTDNTGFDVSGNVFFDNWSIALQYEVSYNAQITGNNFVDNAWGAGPTNPSFPVGAVYISESGGDDRVPGYSSGSLAIEDNTFVDNWSGVVLWESANRFCGADNGTTSTLVCTLVDPAVANVRTCTRANLAGATPSGHPDYYDLCRWETRDVTVSDDDFDFTEADVPGCDGSANSCGENAIFSQYGTDPGWSPYKGTVIETAITTGQHNLFTHNTYSGPWSFLYGSQSGIETMAQWQANSQDVRSERR